jgi:hypothetical protein
VDDVVSTASGSERGPGHRPLRETPLAPARGTEWARIPNPHFGVPGI